MTETARDQITALLDREETGIAILDGGFGMMIAEGTRDLLRRNGAEYGACDTAETAKYDRLDTTLGDCFSNAANGALEYANLTYCEGYAIAGDLGIPMGHAWLIDEEGRTIDSTWENGHSYCGIALQNEDLCAALLATETYGLFDFLWQSGKGADFIRTLLGAEG